MRFIRKYEALRGGKESSRFTIIDCIHILFIHSFIQKVY
ncbi:hypothetical protein KP78_30050 [Jeotgalibacillus soli]|uniref:Uncharacterized protein n=1 Tax=Jeotgalibacillus soli TaxID=889306 RepID=A0A0C2VLX3_9BACL|nr:hypothetical protein KP78_30050 [Jeotgalibacillus soli]